MVCCLCYKGRIEFTDYVYIVLTYLYICMFTLFWGIYISFMLCFIATETEGVGLHGDGYSSEENDESIYHDYKGN